MMFDPLSILAVFAPMMVEAGKAAVSRWIAPDQFKPATIEQYEAMRRIDLDLFKAMNEAGTGGASYPWVEAVRSMMRPGVVLVVMTTWGYQHGIGAADTVAIDNFAAAVGFYLFADRTLFNLRKAEK